MADAIKVDGLAQLQRAFGAADRALRNDLNDALMEAAAPVRRDAQTLTLTTISGMRKSPQWATMRTGQARGVVYVVPVERGTRSRANPRLKRGQRFVQMVLLKAMNPALARNRGNVIRRLDQMLVEVGKVWDRNGL